MVTPINSLVLKDGLKVFFKLEYLNNSGSFYDRIADKILKKLLSDGILKEGITNESVNIFIPSTGNLALSLSSMLAIYSPKITCLIPESFNKNIPLLKALNLEVIRIEYDLFYSNKPGEPNSVLNGMLEECKQSDPNGTYILVNEVNFKNEFELAMIELADEIIKQTNGDFQYLIFGDDLRTSIISLLTYLKQKVNGLKTILVEPLGSSSLKHEGTSVLTKSWITEGIGYPRYLDLPEGLIDISIKVPDQISYSNARRLIKKYGILAGPSSGAVLEPVLKLNLPNNSKIVAVLNDSCKAYQNTLLDDEWLIENEMLDPELALELQLNNEYRFQEASVEDLQLPEAITIKENATIKQALDEMEEFDFSQLPVTSDSRKMLGFITKKKLESLLASHKATLSTLISEVVIKFGQSSGKNSSYVTITPDTPLIELAKFFEKYPVGFVTDPNRKWCLGVVTKFDLLKAVSKRKGFIP